MLEPRDFDTATWDHLKSHIAQKLAAHRADLERPQTDDPTSRILRGRIAELKALLALETAPAPEADPE